MNQLTSKFSTLNQASTVKVLLRTVQPVLVNAPCLSVLDIFLLISVQKCTISLRDVRVEAHHPRS